MAVNMLNAGQAAFVSYETDLTLSGGGSPDALRFVLLADILSGTTLYITDRTWNGSAFTTAAGDGTFTYSAASDLPAGTIVTLTHAELAAAGVSLSSAGESVYLYQGSDANTPGTFIFSMNIAANAFGNTTLNTGLVFGFSAVAISHDNAAYSGSALGMPVSQSTDIATAGRWFGSDQDDLAGTTDYSEVIDTTVTNAFTAPDMVLIAAMAGGGQSDAILRVGNDEEANVGTGLTRLFRDNPAFNRLADVTFDLDAGHFFVVDSDGNNTNRILRGDIADLKNSNESPTLLTIFSTDGLNEGVGPQAPGELIPSIEIDKATQKIYWMDGDLFGGFEGGFQLWEANYDGTGAILVQTIDTQNLDPNFGLPGGVSDFAVTGGFAYVASSAAAIDGLGAATVDQNHILQIDLVTGDVTFLDLGDAGLGAGFHDGRLDPSQGQIIGIDVNTATGDVWFVTQGITSSDKGGIFRFAQGATIDGMVGGTLTEMWEMPAEDDFSSIQSFPTSNLTHIEVDEIGGRYYVSSTSDLTVAESDASIFSGSLTAAPGTAPTLFVRAFEPTANGAPQGMEIDYAPVNSAVGTNATFVEGGADAGIFASVTLTDADNAKAYRATFTITEGFLPGDALVADSLQPGFLSSTNPVTGQFEISRADGEAIDLAELEAILEQVAFTSTSDNPTNYGANQTRTIAFTTSDGLATSDPVSVTITVEGVNDAPVNTLGAAVTGQEDEVIAVTGLSISDLDADPANQDMQVTLTAEAGTLTLDPTTLGNLSFSMGDGGSDTTMTFSGRANDINAALATLTLAPPANHNGTLDITITTSDLGHTGTGGPATDSDTKTITINAVNDAPVVSGDGTESTTTLEDIPSVIGQTVSALFPVQFSDELDNQAANGGSSANTLAGVAVVQNGSAPGTGQWEWFNGATWNSIGAASDSAAPIFSAGTAIRFNPAPDYNGAAPTLTVHLIDASASLAGPNGTTVDISAPAATGGTTAYSTGTVVLGSAITPVNDAPTIAELDTDTVIYVEQSPSPLLDDGTDALVGDIDSANFDGGSLTVQITTGLQLGEDAIAISTAGVVSVSGLTVSVSGTQIATFTSTDQNATIEFTFNADATPAAVQALVRALAYSNTAGDDPTEGDRTIEWSLVDGDGTANGGSDTATVSTTVTVQAVNDAPTAVADNDSVQEDTAPNPISGNVLTNDTDPEDDTLLVTTTGTFMLTYGSLLLNGDGGYSYTLNNDNPLVDELATGDTLTETFTYTVSDGNSGQDTALLTITINGKTDNAAPESTDNLATIDEDTTYTFAAADFDFDDVDVGDVLASVRIDTLSIPAGATLRLSGVDVIAADVIAVGDIPNLVFTPAPDGNGTNYASFTFSVSDGTDFDATPNTFSFQVDPVADTPTITSDGGGATASVNVAENTTAVTTVVATDPDAGTTITYSISGGADAAKFTINSANGALAFLAAPDFETPTDVGGNNVYDVQVTASDGALTDVQNVAVTVTDAAEAPTITSNGGGATAAISIAENSTAVTTVVATDPDAGTTIAYSISGGADAAKFTIDATTGALAFAAAPDFETPTDGGTNNVYDVQVTASDGTLSDVQDIAVTVTNQNETPTITSNGGGGTASVNVAENNTAVTTVVATDPDAATTIAYSISGGADAAKFTIDSATGALAFAAAPDFETPADAGGNNVYDVQVTASDGALSDVQDIAVTVTNQNETPTITSNGGGATAAISIAENIAAVTTVVATDPDAATTLTYSISGGADAAKFTIDATTGALAFAAAPDFETPTDGGANNVYDVQVTASDGTLTDVQDIAVTVTNQNETPTITSNGGGASATINLAENIATVTTVVATDPDAGTTLTYSISGGADAAQFTIDAATGALAFAAAPDFETPTDVGSDNVYDVQVMASDGTLIDLQNISVLIANANEAPTITSNGGGVTASVSVAENSTAVTTVVATDPDAGTTIAYSISGGADAAKFTIDATTGALAFAAAPDFETPTDGGTNNVYDVQVTASDGTLTDVQDIAVTVTNQNETPTITSNGGGATAAISLAENIAAVTTVVATDPDAGTTLTYSISGGADAARFTIDAATGALAFAAAPDFETATDAGANNVYDVQVMASDGTLSDVQDIAVTVTDSNDAPVITSNGGGASAAISIVENTVAVTTVVATDQDLDAVAYSITGGADAARFTINTTTGALAFIAAPDFEAPTDGGGNNVYNVQVTASDGTLSDMQTIAVTVTNANEAPTLANPIDDQASPEDAAVGFVLPAGTFDDPDGTTLTLTATLAGGGALPAWLSFNPGTGAFTGQPPANFNGDINIRVTASDGTSAVSDTFTLSIIPVNDAPIAGDDVVRTQRDVAVSTAISVLLANDFDPDGDTITLTGVSGPSNGSVAIVGNAVVFTPDAGFVGQAGFSYSISDGNGLGTVGTVTVNVGAVNSAPQVNPDTEVLFTLLGRAIAFDVVATDADGDVLAFAAGAPANGTITQGTGGAFVYTPDTGFLGTDTVTVIVSDADGATDTYTATIKVVTPDTPDDWRLLTTDGWIGEIGGSGAVFGTNGFQDITVLDIAGHIAFDPSFNGGGDVIRLAGSAADWHIARESSNAILFDGDTLVTIPVGIVGAAIVFDDGARELLFSVQNNTMSIGDQAFGEALARIDTAPHIGAIDDSAANPAATSTLLLQEGVDVTAGGRIDVFGTGTEAEVVTLTYGAITFDPSFNEGGDTVVLDGDADSFTASRFGSSLLLEGSGYDLVIPVGIDGMEITFADDTRTLIYNPENDAVLLGNQTIGLEMIPVSEFA
jgi:VCBS repeat-containing protein